MSKTLLLDLGNSRLKWAVYSKTNINASPLENGSFDVANIEAKHINEAWQKLPQIDQAYISAVGQTQAITLCQQVLTELFEINLQRIETDSEHRGISNSYAKPQDLGVDRWMGLLAAHSLYKEAIIVSMGTANTVDVVSEAGQHLGGYIVPGHKLLHRSLSKGTADDNIDVVNKANQTLESIGLGDSTHMCVAQGIVRMQLAFIQHIQAEFPAATLVLTGGASVQIEAFLNSPYQLELSLVFKGMLTHINNTNNA